MCKNVQLRFIDSYGFIASSLDKVASNLCGTSEVKCDKCRDDMELIKISGEYTALFGCEKCRAKKTKDLDKRVLKNNLNHTSRFWGCDEKFCLMIRKRCVPIRIYGRLGKISRDKLPPKDAFYSRLNMKRISDQDYEHAQRVWNRITSGYENITLGDYHDVYLKTDVLLLTDVF